MPLSSDTASKGEGEGEGDRMEGALLGAKALVIATTLVMGFTGLGMWVAGKAVGAENVRFFFLSFFLMKSAVELTIHLLCYPHL